MRAALMALAMVHLVSELMIAKPLLPQEIDRVTEEARGPLYVHRGWADEMPWLVQGVTPNSADMSLFAGSPAGEVMGRWQALRDGVGCRTVVHAHQVHGAVVHSHGTLPPGLFVASDGDGHATREPGLLLAVSVADCVPVLIVAPRARVVVALHAGWRGTAAGILEAGLGLLSEHFGLRPTSLRIHLGPAICGDCYAVGPEVLSGLGVAEPATHADVRAALALRALAAGVPAEQITVSTFCTRHGDSPFYSHRGGCPERQIAVLGMLER